MKKIVPIFYACDDSFIKYNIVSLKSLIDNSSKDYQYNIYILITNLSSTMKKEVLKLEQSNVKIYFDNVNKYLSSISNKLAIRDYYSKTTYFRLFIAEMYPQYNKVIYIDSDTIVRGNIAELYETDLKGNYVGACHEQVMIQEDVYGTYVEKVLGINRNYYFNAGVLLINSYQFRKQHILEKFIDLLHTYTFKVTQDEDYLNILCKDRVLWLDQKWNNEMFGNITVSKEDTCIIHYIMVSKPWHYRDCLFADEFHKYASQVDVYPLIEKELNNYSDKEKARDLESCNKLMELAIYETNREDSYFAIVNKEKDGERLNIVNKILQFESEGKFDQDVEIDPPTKELLPDEVDYLRKSLISKIKTKVAFSAARKFLNQILDNKQMIVKNIIGIENFQNLNSGAIITCNHFNAFDSFAIQMAYEAAKQKKRKFYRVIREGNYTNFPGFYGFLMRSCNTLPLSSNCITMKKFIKSTDQLLQDGHFVLFYPEQSMWWNYRKPKPLKDGAYKFASRNNVPVLPCFITMKDSDIIGEDGFPVQEYTIHIGKPIYPNSQLSVIENAKEMKKENYDLWKEIYEDNYDLPLQYNLISK